MPESRITSKDGAGHSHGSLIPYLAHLFLKNKENYAKLVQHLKIIRVKEMYSYPHKPGELVEYRLHKNFILRNLSGLSSGTCGALHAGRSYRVEKHGLEGIWLDFLKKLEIIEKSRGFCRDTLADSEGKCEVETVLH